MNNKFSYLFLGFFCVFAAFHTANSQNTANEYNQISKKKKLGYSFSSYVYYPTADSLLALNDVHEIKECHYSMKRNQKQLKNAQCSQKVVDNLGRVIESTSFKGKKNLGTKKYTYNNKNKVIKVSFEDDYSKKTSSIHYVFNDSDMLTEVKVIVNGKIKHLKRNYYQNGKRLTHSYSFGKDTLYYDFLTRNTYESDTGRLLKSELFDFRGKPVHVWDYSCNPQGDLKKSDTKNQVRICKSELKLPNGHKQMVYEEIVGNQIHRGIYEYDEFNRVVAIQNYKGKSGEILAQTSSIVYSDTGKTSFYKYFNIKTGLVEKEYTYRYNTLNQTTRFVSGYYSRKGKLTTGWESEYSYKGNLLTRVVGNSLKDPGNQSITEYEYKMVN